MTYIIYFTILHPAKALILTITEKNIIFSFCISPVCSLWLLMPLTTSVVLRLQLAKKVVALT